jgi:hypothetical protein
MIGSQEAAATLQDIDATGRRSAELYSYSLSAPYCFIWGAVWLIGYGGEALLPRALTGWLWLAAEVAGFALTMHVSIRQAARGRGRRGGWRIGVLFAILWLFTWALFAVLHPVNDYQIGVYFPLLFSAIYAAIGLWLGLRYVLVGAFMAVATLGAYFFLREYFFAWMALAGGGSLLLTGVWLQRA